MAQRTPRPTRGAAPARAAAKSKKASSAGVEIVEEAPGLGLDAGIGILTSILLIGALVLVDMMLAKNGDGLMF